MKPEFDCKKIRKMYSKVVENPNKNLPRWGYIRCPDCGEEILMVPRLQMMSIAIEAHVQRHKMLLQDAPILAYHKAIVVRLSLVQQVLLQTCHVAVS